ncbi:MAG: putative dsRNA-binding protein, partial [Granulosicoccaceae bacterium]
TRLQERLQGRGRPLPQYELLEVRGKPHEQKFTVKCSLDDAELSSEGEGSSRRRAEQIAAAAMLQVLDKKGAK